jgi:beta-mannosidase
MGTLFWQLNDVWAGPSWSTVDHTGRWKAAMYEVARSYRPVVIDLAVTKDRVVASLWNERPDLKHARRVLQVFATDGRMVHADTTREALGTGLNAWVDQPLAALVGKVPLDSALVRVGVLDNAGAVIAERTLALAPWGRMAWMPSDIRMERVRSGATTSTYRLSCDRPVPVVWLEAPGAAFSDDHFPLLPGTPREVVVTGTDEQPRLNSWP